MGIRRLGISAFAVALWVTAPSFAVDDASDRREMVAESIRSYPGLCPCPYNEDRAGRACGARSAYSRPGGAAPYCYPADISDAKLAQWRANQRLMGKSSFSSEQMGRPKA